MSQGMTARSCFFKKQDHDVEQNFVPQFPAYF